MISRSADIIWQPLHTPSANVSGRAKNALKSSRRREWNRIDFAQPSPAPSTSPYEKPPHTTRPRKSSRLQATFEQIGHVHVVRGEAGAMERRRHLDVTVDALLAQDRDLRPRALRDVRRRDVLLRLERQSDVQARVVGLDRSGELLARALRIVAQLDHAEARLGPRAAQRGARFVQHDLAARANRPRDPRS